MKKYLNDDSKKYFIYATFCIGILIILYFSVLNITNIYNFIISIFTKTATILRPAFFGFIMAFFLYKPTDILTNNFIKHKYFKKPKVARVIASIISIISMILILVAFFYIILPSLIDTVTKLATNMGGYLDATKQYLLDIANNPTINKTLKNFNINIANPKYIDTLTGNFLKNLQKWVEGAGTSLMTFALSLGSLLFNLFIGIFFALYMLIDKKELSNQIKRLSKVILKTKYHIVSTTTHLTSYMFFQYLMGKGICSLIVGILVYIACIIFKIEYAPLIACIITVTNMIPMFGPFLGAIPCIAFALISGGLTQGLIMGTTILVVQQIDANILAPKILGDAVGLNGFWVMFSIIFMGGFFGVLGLILAIPTFAVIKILLSEWLYDKEKHSKDENYERHIKIRPDINKK